MNTSIADAHNLAWKLAASLEVASGAAESTTSPSAPIDVLPLANLLLSYNDERRAAALRAAQLSLHLFDRSLVVPREIGLPPSAPRLLADALSLPLGSGNSTTTATPKLTYQHGMRRMLSAVFDSATAVARSAVISSMSPTSPRVQRVRHLVRSGQILPLVFLNHDLGRQEPYRSPFPAHARADQPFVPSVVLGARLPHCWLEEQTCPVPREFSSIDLPWWRPHTAGPRDRGCRFVLLVRTESGQVAESPWVHAGLALAAEHQFDLVTAAIQPSASAMLLSDDSQACVSSDHLVVVRAQVGGSSGVLGSESNDALLVRPDGIVCWISAPTKAAPSTEQCVQQVATAWRQCITSAASSS